MPVFVNDKEQPFSHHFFQYSEDTETLLKLLERITITLLRGPVVPAPWDTKGTLDALLYHVTVSCADRSFSFPYYASHNDAQLYRDHSRAWDVVRKRQDHLHSLPYDILCCIGSDYGIADCDPEDIGMDSDSIKDMAKWNEMRAHSRMLRQCLRLTEDEQASLPS